MMTPKARRLLVGRLPFALLAAAAIVAPSTASADPITYDDITLSSAAGITYRRAPSATKANWDAVKIKPFMSQAEINATPLKWRGAPGVAVLDYDGDGDLDLYVTNGPGRANSLYKSLFKETGELKFVDVAQEAGVAATDMDGTGVCYGDIDNDGDLDLFVLGRMENNRLFENDGTGHFTNITVKSKTAGGVLGHSSCAFGDVNGDGLLDIVVSNTFDMARQEAIFTNSFGYNHPNQLLVNKGDNVFEDRTASSGILQMYGVPPGDATISWSVALVDYDQDGDLDLFQADDQAATPPSAFAGKDRGFLQIWKNDGTGRFTNVTQQAGTAHAAQHMGLSFGDLNSDGFMDVFSTSVGDYLIPQFGLPVPPGIASTRWYLGLGAPGGAFVRPGAGPLGATPFGWSTAMFDYDNDADTDVVFYGNLDVGPFITADNPGVILANDGNANLSWDKAATAQTHDKVRRGDVNALAIGDLNDDGFADIVHVSGHYMTPTKLPLVRANQQWGSVFDETAYVAPLFFPIGPNEWEWSGRETDEGFMGVQVSSASNGNGWVKVRVKGTKDLTTRGKNNRDGIGAVVKFTPDGGRTVMSPVLGGSGHSSQHSLVQGFGLGTTPKGTVDVLWPGGVKNRVYDVVNGETLTLPEIPCDYARTWSSGRTEYQSCVNGSVDQLYFRNVVTADEATRLRANAMRAYDESH